MTIGTEVPVHVWYDKDQDVIKMRVAGELTSVNGNAESKRGHPNLYKKLATALRDAGEAFPAGVP